METCALNYITKNVDKLTALKWVVCAEGVIHKSPMRLGYALTHCSKELNTTSLDKDI
jgi:hypothetical protein